MKTARKWRISGAIALVATACGAVIASSSTGGPPIEKASEIVPAFSEQQGKVDQLPAPAAMTFLPAGIDPATTRLVGESTEFKYYAAPLGGEEICLITVNGQGSAVMMGCTVVKGFEGLRVSLRDKTGDAWLVAATGAEKALDSTDRSQWVQTAPNFLVRSDSQRE